MKLQVLICTCGGLERVAGMRLPIVDGVGYLVSCQSQPQDIPDPLVRPDIEVRFSDTHGLSRNRNAALDACIAPYALFADDDLIFYAQGLASIIEKFESDSALDLACFKIVSEGERKYPAESQNAWLPFKGYNPCSVEIAVRMSAVRQAGLRFNPDFGLGAPRFKAAEEDLFLLNARKKGLKAMFYPIEICEHPGDSTGRRMQPDPGVLRASGVVIALKYPYTSMPRLVLKALRCGGSFFRSLRFLLQGWWHAMRHYGELI